MRRKIGGVKRPVGRPRKVHPDMVSTGIAATIAKRPRGRPRKTEGEKALSDILAMSPSFRTKDGTLLKKGYENGFYIDDVHIASPLVKCIKALSMNQKLIEAYYEMLTPEERAKGGE